MERAARLRRRVFALGPRGRGTRLPEDLRHEIVSYARKRQSRGAGLKQIGHEVGVSGESIRRWLEAGDEKRELVPVEIVPEGVEGEVVVVVSPRGYRVEGLGVASAAALLRMLG